MTKEPPVAGSTGERVMRRLLLLRHAKAEGAQAGRRDQDRPLAGRGRDDARTLGAYMASHRLIPDAVVVSPSARTRETWNLAAEAFTKTPPAIYDDRIYEAEPAALLEIINETRPEIGTLLMIGHNPGFEELAAMLVAAGDIGLRQRLGEGFPTGALAVMDFVLDWNQVHPRSGRLERFVTPRSLTEALD